MPRFYYLPLTGPPLPALRLEGGVVSFPGNVCGVIIIPN
jgi:hypothetical protein